MLLYSKCVCSVAQSCPTLCNPMDCSLPRSSVHGIFQVSIVEQFAISYSRGTSPYRDQIRISWVSCIGRWILYHGAIVYVKEMYLGETCSDFLYIAICMKGVFSRLGSSVTCECVCVCMHVCVSVSLHMSVCVCICMLAHKKSRQKYLHVDLNASGVPRVCPLFGRTHSEDSHFLLISVAPGSTDHLSSRLYTGSTTFLYNPSQNCYHQ